MGVGILGVGIVVCTRSVSSQEAARHCRQLLAQWHWSSRVASRNLILETTVAQEADVVIEQLDLPACIRCMLNCGGGNGYCSLHTAWSAAHYTIAMAQQDSDAQIR